MDENEDERCYTEQELADLEILFESYMQFEQLFRKTDVEKPLSEILGDLDVDSRFYEYIDNNLQGSTVVSEGLKAELQNFADEIRALIKTYDTVPLAEFDEDILGDRRWPEVHASGKRILNQLEIEIPSIIYETH